MYIRRETHEYLELYIRIESIINLQQEQTLYRNLSFIARELRIRLNTFHDQ